MGNILWTPAPQSYAHTSFYSTSESGTSLTYKCYAFTVSKGEVFTELTMSLFSFHFGLLMLLGSWFILMGSIQLLCQRLVWEVCSEFIPKVMRVAGRLLLAMVVYEFIIMKFPQYVKEVLTMELCATFPYTSNEEIVGGVGAIVTLTACAYFGLSVQFSRRQHRLSIKAASYDMAVEELDIADRCAYDDPPEGFQFVQAINNKAKEVLQEKIKQVNKQRRQAKKVTTTTTSTTCINSIHSGGNNLI